MTEPILAWQSLWRRLSQPSIARRVIGTLLAAIALSFVVLVGMDWLALHRSDGSARALPGVTQVLVRSLPATSDRADEALTIVRATLQQLNGLRQQAAAGLDDVQARLQAVGPAGQVPTVLFESSQAPPAPADNAVPPPGASVLWQGRTYWVAQQRTPAWQLTLYEPLPGEVTLLSWMVANLLTPFLIALPLVWLPLWWAVRRGLRPLHGLVAQVQARSPQDPRPLALDLRDAELRPLGDAFDALLARVRLSLQRERQLVQDAAHELRTPLAVISAQAHVLQHATEAAPRQQAHEALERAVQRGAHLVQQLLTLAALDDEPAAPPPPLDLVAAVRQHLVGLAPLAEQRAMTLSLDCPDRLTAPADPSALTCVVLNLVGNALRYAAPGKQVQITLAATPGPDAPGWVLTVADDGPGIDAADRAQLFDRFRRGRGAAGSGSGLGLAIARQAAQRLGGELRLVDGLAGRGVGFELRVSA